MPAECLASARRGRAADLRVIFTKGVIKMILTVTHVTGEDRECLTGHSPATVYKLMLVFDTLIASYQNQKHEWY